MRISTVAVISPGDMGHVVAGVLVEKGFRVVTYLEGRSDVTRLRAARVGMENLGSLTRVVEESNYILSIMPPENALAFAKDTLEVCSKLGRNPVYADCNAISPSTTQDIAKNMDSVGVSFVKIGIIGPPPSDGVTTRFYASGRAVERLSFLDGNGISYRPIGDNIESASSLKMCYAGLTKGTMTLQTGVLTAAEILGIRRELERELSTSQEYHWDLMNKRVPFYAADAGRWAGEMDEISDTFKGIGLTGNLHKGAAEIFRLLESSPLSEETRETLDKSRTLDEAVEIYADTLRSLNKK